MIDDGLTDRYVLIKDNLFSVFTSSAGKEKKSVADVMGLARHRLPPYYAG